MASLITRRALIAGLAALTAAPAAAELGVNEPFDLESADDAGQAEDLWFDPALLPPAESPVDYEIPPADLSVIPERYHRQMVDYAGPEHAGTIIVDPGNRFLFLVRPEGTALRYGVGVGRSGFEWSGDAVIGMKRRWPRWLPPREMVERDPKAAKWANGQPGGPDNPLGARALYLYANGQDTLYRIHGTNAPKSIGKAMSSGCIRMLNEDIADLYRRTIIGARVVVLPATVG